MNIAVISPIAWDNSGGAHRPVQLARQLAARGHCVTYIEIEKSKTRVASENPQVVTLEDLGWDELNLVRAWYGFAYESPTDLVAQVRGLMPASNERGVVICSAPFRPALELVQAFRGEGYALVYDVLDDISEMRALGSYCYDNTAELYLAEQSDLIVTLSPRLREKFARYGDGVLIRDGVDLTPFQTLNLRGLGDKDHRSDLEGLERGEITAGFWGTMWEYNLDVPLLQMATRARPQWQFHFIGAYDLDPARPSLAETLAAPNVHFHPSVTREMLARCADAFDVCLLPTPVTPFNLARDPLKVYEYLACHKPVVSTALEQLEGMPYVYLARDAEDFLSKIETAARVEINHAELDAYLQEQMWAKRTDQLLRALETLPTAPHASPPPPRGAMLNAVNELDRWQAFAQHLERMVQDRESHVLDLEHALAQSSITKKLVRALGGA